MVDAIAGFVLGQGKASCCAGAILGSTSSVGSVWKDNDDDKEEFFYRFCNEVHMNFGTNGTPHFRFGITTRVAPRTRCTAYLGLVITISS